MGLRGALAAVVVLTVVVLGAGPVGAQEGCGVPAAPGWTRVEAGVWRQLCAGHPADFNPQDGERLDPTSPEGWDQTRVLSSAFVERLLDQPYASALDRHGIVLGGAWFPDGLDISEATTGFPLRCLYCRIAGLDAEEAVVDGTLDLRGSAVEGDLTLALADIAGDLDVSGGAVVSGLLFADRLTVVGSVFLDDRSRFADIRLRGAHIGSNLDVDGESVVTGLLTADGLTVTGDVFLRDGSRFADIRLLGAHIGGQLAINGESTVTGLLAADGLTVTGDVFLNDGSRFADINLVGAHIGGTLAINNGSVVSGLLNAEQLTVTGGVFLYDRSRFADINLVGAHIGGTLDVSGGSTVSGLLAADGLTVTGNVFLHDRSRFADIRLPGADIGGQLAIANGSVVSGLLAADQLTVTEDVFLRDGRFADIRLVGADIGGLIVLNGAVWEPGGALDLSQARAGGVFTDEQAASLPARLDLDGFTFPQWANPDPGTLERGWFTDTWLARMPAFRPGPYTQLAEVMDAAGHPTIADDLRYHRNNAQRQLVPWTRPDRWGRQLHWLVLGYGLRPWRALGCLAAVWLTGLLVFWLRPRLRPPRERVRSRPRRWLARAATLGRLRLVVREEWSAGLAGLYSLDRLVPAVKLVPPDRLPDRTRPQHAWAVAEQLLGWLLTLFLVGWLGSLLV